MLGMVSTNVKFSFMQIASLVLGLGFHFHGIFPFYHFIFAARTKIQADTF
jgi:hypothetical protein